MATGYPVTVLGKEAALLRQGTANARGDEQKSSQAGMVGRACNTRQSPLSILSQARILGARVRKDACLPREVCRDASRTDRRKKLPDLGITGLSNPRHRRKVAA